MQVVRATAALDPASPEAAAAYQKAELMAAEWANPIPLLYPPSHSAYNNSRLGGEFTTSGALGSLMWDTVYVKK